MPLSVTRFAPENISSADITKALIDPRPCSYKLEYFEVSGAGSVARDILAYGEADWEDLILTYWPAEVNSPFGVFPVLHIETANGLEVKLAETLVIEHYLAKKFGLLGDNEWEEQQIKMFHSSSLYLRERLFTRVTGNYKEVMDKALDLFLTRHLPLWIETHTKHLKDNGGNGHYVGDKISLADLLTANDIDHFQIQFGGPKIVELIKKSPDIWKVKEMVDAEPRLQSWRQSEAYKKHISASVAMYANMGL
ncbi:Glutathione S-transferase S1 [Mortierella antarctica]|nr:Glutathione S-transferase S1 [Mortierella antarctica]